MLGAREEGNEGGREGRTGEMRIWQLGCCGSSVFALLVGRVWPESLCLHHGSVWMPSGDGRRRGGDARSVPCKRGGLR